MIHPDSAFILSAVLLDLLIGDPYWLPHPVVAIGCLVSFLDHTLRRSWLNEKLAGVFLLILVAGTAAAIAASVMSVLSLIHPLLSWLCALAVSASCLATRSLHRESAKVASALQAGDIKSARRFLSYIVGRDTEQLDESEIWRAVVETVAENTSDGIIAPLFWLAIGGPVVAIAYKAVSTLDSMVGYKNERYMQMGWASARMDDLLNFVPARLTALLIAAVAPVAGGSAYGALRIVARDRRNHPSPNSGHPEAAAAGALGVRLGGAASYRGIASWKKYIGDADQPLDGGTYHGMIKIMYFSSLLMAAVCVGITYLLRGFHVPFL